MLLGFCFSDKVWPHFSPHLQSGREKWNIGQGLEYWVSQGLIGVLENMTRELAMGIIPCGGQPPGHPRGLVPAAALFVDQILGSSPK